MSAVSASWTEQQSLRNTKTGVPSDSALPDTDQNLQILVLFTDVPNTLAALRYAANLPYAEHSPIRLLVPQVVPYPLPLHKPPVSPVVLARWFRTLARNAKVETTIDILFCRDPWDAIQQTLATPHLVVIGGRRRWWLTREERIANRLRSEGHRVVLTETK